MRTRDYRWRCGKYRSCEVFNTTMLRTELVLVVLCALLVCTTAYKRQARHLSCRDRLKQTARPLPPGYEPPRCDESGNYKGKQCYGEWTGRGHCLCVKPRTGERFDDIKGVEAGHGVRMTCRCALDNQLVADRAAYCDLYTGDYLRVVCIGKMCRCAERWGAPMHAFGEFNKGDSNCLCARQSSDLAGRPGRELNCNPYGQFDPVQCSGSMCFCVDKDGTQFGESVPRQETQKLKC